MENFLPETDALEWLRNWRLDWESVAGYLSDVAKFHIDQHGVIGVIVIGVVVLVALVSFRPTHYIGSLLVVNLVRAISSLLQLTTAGIGLLLITIGTKVGVAGIRTFGRSLVDLGKKSPDR